MDNNINGNYAHLRVQQAQTQASQVSSQSDVQPREHSAQMHDDAAAEQLGRSQLLRVNIPSAPEPVKLTGLKDILSNEHISDEDTDKILMNFDFSTEECAALRNQYPDLNKIVEAFDIFFNFSDIFKDASKELIQENIGKSCKNPKELEVLSYFSKKNFNILQEKFGFSNEDALSFLFNLNSDFDKYNAAFKISQLTGSPFAVIIGNINDLGRKFVCPINNEQLLAMKELEASIGSPFNIYKAGLIENSEQITPQFIESLEKELDSFLNQDIRINNLEQDPVSLLCDMQKINAFIKKYGLDFGKMNADDKFDKIRNIVNSPYAEKSVGFLLQCSDEVKKQCPDLIFQAAADKDFMENTEGLAKLLNTIAKIPKNGMIYRDLLQRLKKEKAADIEGITKVAQAFADVGSYAFDSSSCGPLFAIDFKTGKPNYDECVKFIHLIQEFYSGEDSEYSLDDFMSQVWRGIDYENYESCFAKLKDMGLYGKIAPWDMKEIMENPDNPDTLTTAIKYRSHPLISGEVFLFDQFDSKKIDAEYNKVCDSIRNLNPGYKDMDVNDCVLILKSYSKLCHYFYNRLQFGTDIEDEDLNIDKVLQKNKGFDCAEYAREFFTTDFPNINIKDKIMVFSKITDANKDIVVEILKKGEMPKEKLLANIGNENFLWLALRDYKQAENIVANQENIVLEHPEKYVNGEYKTKEDMIKDVDTFFKYNQICLMVLASATDKETVNYLLRMRFEDAREYLGTLTSLGLQKLDMLSRFNNSLNVDGKPFLPAQKIGFIDLLNAYKDSNLSMDKLQTMLDSGKVDLAELNMDLFNQVMKSMGMTDDEIASIPKEKLTSWDTKYIHLLVKDIHEENNQAFSDILRAGNFSDFRQYIQDTSNVYGQTNAVTRKKFADLGMNYDKWLKPSQENEVVFKAKDDNKEQLVQIQKQFLEDISALRQGPVKGFIDKQYPKCIKNNEFVIPLEFTTSKAKLNEFITGVIKALDPVWKRAQGNAQNPDPKRSATARNTLTILDHFNQRVKDIESLTETKGIKNIDVKIKMWDRVPQKDIFQGNYSTCCIGMGGGNGTAMPYYLMNTAFNMIELVDNESGKTIGNALCFFEKNEKGKPIFVIDNIEINNSQKPSDKVGLQLRDAITQYAANVAKEVTGNDDTQIVMGGQYNDVPCEDLPKRTQKIEFVGDISREDIYSDLYTGWPDKEDLLKPTRQITWILK